MALELIDNLVRQISEKREECLIALEKAVTRQNCAELLTLVLTSIFGTEIVVKIVLAKKITRFNDDYQVWVECAENLLPRVSALINRVYPIDLDGEPENLDSGNGVGACYNIVSREWLRGKDEPVTRLENSLHTSKRFAAYCKFHRLKWGRFSDHFIDTSGITPEQSFAFWVEWVQYMPAENVMRCQDDYEDWRAHYKRTFWGNLHGRVLSWLVALLPLRLTPYDTLFLIDWLPPHLRCYDDVTHVPYDPNRLKKLRLIEGVAASYAGLRT